MNTDEQNKVMQEIDEALKNRLRELDKIISAPDPIIGNVKPHKQLAMGAILGIGGSLLAIGLLKWDLCDVFVGSALVAAYFIIALA